MQLNRGCSSDFTPMNQNWIIIHHHYILYWGVHWAKFQRIRSRLSRNVFPDLKNKTGIEAPYTLNVDFYHLQGRQTFADPSCAEWVSSRSRIFSFPSPARMLHRQPSYHKRSGLLLFLIAEKRLPYWAMVLCTSASIYWCLELKSCAWSSQTCAST